MKSSCNGDALTTHAFCTLRQPNWIAHTTHFKIPIPHFSMPQRQLTSNKEKRKTNEKKNTFCSNVNALPLPLTNTERIEAANYGLYTVQSIILLCMMWVGMLIACVLLQLLLISAPPTHLLSSLAIVISVQQHFSWSNFPRTRAQIAILLTFFCFLSFFISSLVWFPSFFHCTPFCVSSVCQQYATTRLNWADQITYTFVRDRMPVHVHVCVSLHRLLYFHFIGFLSVDFRMSRCWSAESDAEKASEKKDCVRQLYCLVICRNEKKEERIAEANWRKEWKNERECMGRWMAEMHWHSKTFDWPPHKFTTKLKPKKTERIDCVVELPFSTDSLTLC